jgi:hypothetical protein
MVFFFSGRQTGKRSQADYAELLKLKSQADGARSLELGIIRYPA